MRPATCPRCRACSEPGARFCERCGAPLLDNTTRYLSAAAHTNARFCNDALNKFTVEPMRAVPASPGLDTAAVLRDALAARNRRRLRDVVVFLLLLLVLVLSPPIFIAWAMLAVVVRVGRVAARERSSWITTVVVAVLLAIAVTGYPFVLAFVIGVAAGAGVEFRDYLHYLALAFVVLAGVALTIDAYLVNWLVQGRFRRSRFVPDPRLVPSGAERALRTFGVGARVPAVDRVESADHAPGADGIPLVVHRGFVPFVGAGLLRAHERLAISLEPRDDTVVVTDRIDVVDLHDRICAAVAGLRTSSSLGPGGRLADLSAREHVFVSAADLVENAGNDLAREILPVLDDPRSDAPPASSLPTATARDLATGPEEWARYYRCFRIETWNRDLILSTFVHLGADDRNLYMERVHCVLAPLDKRFRSIDRPVSPLRPLGSGLLALVEFPASLPSRSRSFVSARRIRQRAGEIVPDRYGADLSLRELAADDEYRTYYQLTDAFRYQELLDRVLLRSIGAYLEDLGFSAVEFQKAFTRTINDFRGAQFSNSAVGPDARVVNGPEPAQKETR